MPYGLLPRLRFSGYLGASNCTIPLSPALGVHCLTNRNVKRTLSAPVLNKCFANTFQFANKWPVRVPTLMLFRASSIMFCMPSGLQSFIMAAKSILIRSVVKWNSWCVSTLGWCLSPITIAAGRGTQAEDSGEGVRVCCCLCWACNSWRC